MATIKELIERIETRLFLASGLDVQTHAEDQIVEMLRGVYNTLFDDFWYPDHTLFMSATLDGSTGQVIEDLSTKILRFQDIHSVFWDHDQTPLPRILPGTSIGRIRTRSIMPSGDPRSVFRLFPNDETGPVHIWYKTKIDKSVWDDNNFDTVINFDDEVLMLGVVHEFLVNDDSNSEATKTYGAKFSARQKQIRDAQWNLPISKRPLERDGPLSRWD